MRRLAAVMTTTWVSLAACFFKPEPPGDMSTTDGGTTPDGSEASPTPDAGLSCDVHEFGTQACAPWGTAIENGGSAVPSMNQLVLMVFDASGQAGCRSEPASDLRRAIVEVDAALAGPDEVTEIVLTAGNLRFGAELRSDGAMGIELAVMCNTGQVIAVPYDETGWPVIALEREADQVQVVRAASLGAPPEVLGSCSAGPGALDTVQLELLATRDTSLAGPYSGDARFASLRLCR